MATQLFTTADGINARPVNPYLERDWSDYNDNTDVLMYQDWAVEFEQFKRENPPLPLTTERPDLIGKEFSGELVWQNRLNKDLVDAGIEKEIRWGEVKNVEAAKELYKEIPDALRCAVQPVPVKGEGKVEQHDTNVSLSEQTKLSVEEAAKEYARGKDTYFHYDDGREPYLVDGKASAGFLAGHTHALTSSNLVEVEWVLEILETEKVNIQSAHDSCPITKSKHTYNYGIKVLTNIINQFKNKYEKG